MFLKASQQPPVGTLVRIDLELPSSTVIELSGVIVKHVTDPQKGTGVDLALEPLPTKSVWMIESALAAVKGPTGAVPVVAPDKDNFQLRPDSQAFHLAFQPLDLSGVGPRPDR